MNWQTIGLAVGLVGVLFGLCWRWATVIIQKLAVVKLNVGVVDSPPNGLVPAEIGMLLNGKLTARELVATLLDLQARRVIHMEVVQTKIIAHLNQSEHKNIKDFELVLLSKIFTGSLKQRDISGIDKEFLKKLIIDLQNTIRTELVEEKVYDQPPRIKRTGPILLGFVIICVVVAVVYGLNYLLPGTASIVLAVVGLAGGWWLVNSGRLSGEGVHDMEQTAAFKKYLSDTRQKADHVLFQKYLAYAYVLGVEKQWAAKCGNRLDRQLIAKLNKM